MATIEYAGGRYATRDDESVLDCLLRHGVDVPYSCKKGNCHSCLLRSLDGAVPAVAQEGLQDTLRAQRYFLACCCRPAGPLTVAAAGSEARTPAQIGSLGRLSDTVVRVRLTLVEPVAIRPGQFVSLVRPDGLARSYSVASLPEEPEVELHVRRVPNGRMSRWLYDEATPGTWVEIGPPAGTCFYVQENPRQPLLLAGTGTGLAPLYGIARDALAHRHTGPIHLFHGGVDRAGLYLQDELYTMSCEHPNFSYHPSVQRGPAPYGMRVGALTGTIAAALPSLAGWKAYVCGNPDIVSLLRKHVFLAGVASGAICYDSFLPAAARSPQRVRQSKVPAHAHGSAQIADSCFSA